MLGGFAAQIPAAKVGELRRDPRILAIEPDPVVSGVRVPRLDGPRLAERLVGRGIRVVLKITAYADVDLPGVRFGPKPFDLDALLAVVRRALAGRT